jgi:hypothetical protein
MRRAPPWTLLALLALAASRAEALPCGDLDVDADDGLILRLQLGELISLAPLQAARCDVIADGAGGPPATPAARSSTPSCWSAPAARSRPA